MSVAESGSGILFVVEGHPLWDHLPRLLKTYVLSLGLALD